MASIACKIQIYHSVKRMLEMFSVDSIVVFKTLPFSVVRNVGLVGKFELVI